MVPALVAHASMAPVSPSSSPLQVIEAVPGVTYLVGFLLTFLQGLDPRLTTAAAEIGVLHGEGIGTRVFGLRFEHEEGGDNPQSQDKSQTCHGGGVCVENSPCQSDE